MSDEPSGLEGLLKRAYEVMMTPLPQSLLPELDWGALARYLKEKGEGLPSLTIPELPTKPQWMRDMETPVEPPAQ